MSALEKKILEMANQFIKDATNSDTYSYEREIKLKVASDIITKLLEDKDGDKVD